MNRVKLFKQGLVGSLLMIALSCQQEKLEPTGGLRKGSGKSEVYVENGIVHFSNHQSFINTIEYLRTAPEESRLNFENDGSFKSFYGLFAKERREFDEFSKRDSSSKTVSTKFLTYKNGVSTLNFVTTAIASVANEDGLLFVGKSLIRFVDNKEIVVTDGSIDKAMNYTRLKGDENVKIFDVEGTEKSIKNGRVSSSCVSISGSSGGGNVFSDISYIETTTKRISVPQNHDDQYAVYFFVKTVGRFDNIGWFDGNSSNNRLQNVFTCDVYNQNNVISAVRETNHYSTSTGHYIEHEDSGIYAGQCYSFQVTYNYARLRQGLINPLPGTPCTIANCTSSYPVYSNDKHTVVGSCY